MASRGLCLDPDWLQVGSVVDELDHIFVWALLKAIRYSSDIDRIKYDRRDKQNLSNTS